QVRAVPGRGIGYGVLRYLGEEGEVEDAAAEVSFNYLGQLDQALAADSPFVAAPESPGPIHSELGVRAHLVGVESRVAGGRLQVAFEYSENVHERATIEGLARRYLEALRALIDHCASPGAVGYTPSDFPEAELDQEELDAFLASLL
ncbi:MAG TPA: condensation domain-containing protein, partial [Longimicrobiaceae bacterium]|nr:condensation domain-containing protein [Longimicrobiaceae bacterium]